VSEEERREESGEKSFFPETTKHTNDEYKQQRKIEATK
jgi:hypothetical protein